MPFKFDKEKMSEYLQKLAKIEQEKKEMIKKNIENPEKFRKLLSKFTDGEMKHIDSDAYLYLNEETSLTQDEFFQIFDTLSWFLLATKRTYNASEVFPEENYFPTRTGHLMFDGKIITIEEVYGQGTALSLSVDSIELASDTNIPMSSIGDFEKNASKIFKANLEASEEIKETAGTAAVEVSNLKLMKKKLNEMSE